MSPAHSRIQDPGPAPDAMPQHAGFLIVRQQHHSLYLDQSCAEYHARRFGGRMERVFTVGALAMVERGLRIADQACEEIVLSKGIAAGDDARALFVPTDAKGAEVSALRHASEAFQMAAGWLIERKRADLVYDEFGVRVQLLAHTTPRVPERTA